MFHWKKRLGPLLIKLVSSVYFWHALCFCRKWLMPIEIAGKQNRENWVALMKMEKKGDFYIIHKDRCDTRALYPE